jgi:hypothetical protein
MSNDITYRQLTLSIRFASFLFPFDALEFVRLLEQNGFVLDEKFANAPFGARIEVSGFVARRANTSVRIETERQVLAVHSADPIVAIDVMTTLENLISKELGVDIEKRTVHHEFVANAILTAHRNPMAAWAKHFGCDPIFRQVSDMLGLQVVPYGMKFAGADMIPDSSNWLEIEIAPAVNSPTDKHFLQLVYRSANREEVFEFMRKLSRFLGQLQRVVEE